MVLKCESFIFHSDYNTKLHNGKNINSGALKDKITETFHFTEISTILNMVNQPKHNLFPNLASSICTTKPTYLVVG